MVACPGFRQQRLPLVGGEGGLGDLPISVSISLVTSRGLISFPDFASLGQPDRLICRVTEPSGNFVYVASDAPVRIPAQRRPLQNAVMLDI